VSNPGSPSVPHVRLPRGTAREQTLETLRHEIISLQLAPGAALSENELAAEHGVSRTPVRESLILLQGEGLVHVYPQVGTFVSLVDPERVAEAQFIREAIECTSLESVAVPLTSADADSLTDNLDRQVAVADSNDIDAFFELDEEFHRTLLQIAGHGSAWRTVTAQKAHLDRARRLSLVNTRPLPTLVEQHRDVANALLAGDRGTAIDHLRTHLRAVFDDIAAIRAARPELFSDSGAGSPVRRSLSQLR
jgi:GntR family transcriptional regulator, rspAB operon transcriptional repressor